MSGNTNPVNPSKSKKVLMIAANPSTSQQTGWPIGFWWSEVTHLYWAFSEAGYEVEIRSSDGGTLHADGYSDPEDASQYSADDILSWVSRKAQHTRRCSRTPKASQMSGPRSTMRSSLPVASHRCTQ